MKLPLFAAGGVVSLLVAITGCGGGDDDVPANAVAKVGDTTIAKAEFDEVLRATVAGESKGGKPIAYEPPDFERCVAAKDKQDAAPEGQKDKGEEGLREDCEKDYQRLRTQAMEFILQQQWVRDEANKRGVEVSPAALRKEFERLRDEAFPTKKAYKEYLLSSGRTEADLLVEVKTTLLQSRIGKKVTAGQIKVSDSEIAAYYAKNKKTLSKPETRSMRIVIAKTEARADAAKQALASGAGWETVAKEYSIDKASAKKGGLVSGITETGDPKIDAKLKNAAVGDVSDPVKNQYGWWVFEVEKVTPAAVPPLKDVRAQITSTLKQQEEQKALDEFAASFREEYRGETVCADDFKVASCKNGPEKNPTTSAPSMQQPQSQQDN